VYILSCVYVYCSCFFCFFFQAEDGIRDDLVTGVQTCALPISAGPAFGALALTRRLGCTQLALHQAHQLAARVERGAPAVARIDRSEERRVGKECRSRWWPHD